jgi:hypothetical protein
VNKGIGVGRKETHEFTLKTGVGEPLDPDAVAGLYRSLLSVFSNSDDLADAFMATYQGTGGKSTPGYR